MLQAREAGDPMAKHERVCFADALGVDSASVVGHDLLAGPPTDADLALHPLLLVGGSGKYSTLDEGEVWLRRFFDFLADVVIPRRVPTFASCFGFQALVRAGGGSMIRDPANAEVGTFEITLTDAGVADPLTGSYAPSFLAQLGHKDRADRLPAGMVHLGSSERAPFQAARVEGTSIVATQFHPELDRTGNAYRYEAYMDAYAGSSADNVDEVLAGMRETPEATSLLPRWVDEVTHGHHVPHQRD